MQGVRTPTRPIPWQRTLGQGYNGFYQTPTATYTTTKQATNEKGENKIVKLIKECADWIWALLKTLPLPPKVSLGLILGFLLITIITCCCCCCRYCCKKKEKKVKAKAKLDLKKTHLFGPNYIERSQHGFDEPDYNMESSLFDADQEIKLGKIKFSLKFDGEENIASVTVIAGKDIPGADISGFSDPYVKVSLVPAGKKQYKTKVVTKTLDPVYNETFHFKNITYNGLMASQLILRVYDFDRFSGHDLLGEAIIPLVDIDLTKDVEEWKILRPEFKVEKKTGKIPNLGHICIGLAYAPISNNLAIFILACKDLAALDEGGFSDPYVKFWLIQDGKKIKKRKTTVKMRTLNPAYNEAFKLEVDFDSIEETSLMFLVCDYDKGEKGDPIGQLILGQLGTGQQLKHWAEMRRNPGKPVAMWHKLRPPTITEE